MTRIIQPKEGISRNSPHPPEPLLVDPSETTANDGVRTLEGGQHLGIADSVGSVDSPTSMSYSQILCGPGWGPGRTGWGSPCASTGQGLRLEGGCLGVGSLPTLCSHSAYPHTAPCMGKRDSVKGRSSEVEGGHPRSPSKCCPSLQTSKLCCSITGSR